MRCKPLVSCLSLVPPLLLLFCVLWQDNSEKQRVAAVDITPDREQGAITRPKKNTVAAAAAAAALIVHLMRGRPSLVRQLFKTERQNA